MDMYDADARSRLENRFESYVTKLQRQRLSWVLEEKQRVAVDHVCNAVRLVSLPSRIESDLTFSKYHLKESLKEFNKYA